MEALKLLAFKALYATPPPPFPPVPSEFKMQDTKPTAHKEQQMIRASRSSLLTFCMICKLCEPFFLSQIISI